MADVALKTTSFDESHMPRRKVNLQFRYGVVKYRGTLQYGTHHELVFESHDALEAMNKLEGLAALADPLHNYSLIINNHQRQTDINDKPVTSSG
jgi:hypothetical protein